MHAIPSKSRLGTSAPDNASQLLTMNNPLGLEAIDPPAPAQRRRRRVKGGPGQKLKGNNSYGRAGKLSCQQCRKWKQKCDYEALEQPCKLCKERGFECGSEQKVRGPKTQQKRRTRRSNAFPGQYVFNFSKSPSVVRPEQPITPVPQPAFSSTPVDTQINLNVFPFTVFEYSNVQVPPFGHSGVATLDPLSLEDSRFWTPAPGFHFWGDLFTSEHTGVVSADFVLHLLNGDYTEMYYVFGLNGSYETGEVFTPSNNSTLSKGYCGPTGVFFLWVFIQVVNSLLVVLLLRRFQKTMARTG